jgi:hypothetical protein
MSHLYASLFVVPCAPQVCLRKALQTAIGCVKQAGRAVNHMFLILLIPLLQTGALLFFLVAFVYYAVHLPSLGEITSQDIPVSLRDGAEIAVRQFEVNDFVGRCTWCKSSFVAVIWKIVDSIVLHQHSYTEPIM